MGTHQMCTKTVTKSERQRISLRTIGPRPNCCGGSELRYPTRALRFLYVERRLVFDFGEQTTTEPSVLLPARRASQGPSNAYEGRSERKSRLQSVHELNDPDLANALAERDEDALTELYDRYRRLAYVIALRIVHDPGTAEDVVQESFLKLWNNAVQFAADRGSLRTWLVTTVRNRAIDSLRGRAAHEREECELKPGVKARGATSDSSHISVSVERTPIREALESLPLEQRLTVELAYFGSFTQPEIAGMMGVPLGTVKGRTRLGLKKLSNLLNGKTLD